MKTATLTPLGEVVPLRDYRVLSQFLASAIKEANALLDGIECEDIRDDQKMEQARDMLQCALTVYHNPTALSA